MRGRFGARLVIRQALKRDIIPRATAKAMLRDDDKLELLIDLAGDEIGDEPSEDGPLLRILKYLLADDGAALKVLISVIMSLFSDSDTATLDEVAAL